MKRTGSDNYASDSCETIPQPRAPKALLSALVWYRYKIWMEINIRGKDALRLQK
jgi:hypothetical protein